MDDEEIKRVILGTGYGKPPQHSQFKKGQSGNPKGRPKSMSDELPFTEQHTLKAILDVAERVVSVRENGEIRHMTMLEVNANALFNKGGKGDPRAITTAFALTQRAEVLRALDIQRQNAIWQHYKNTESAKISEAKARGETITTPLPHPDDIIIDYQKGPRFIGPFTEQEQAMVDHTIRVRDVLILQDALDRRCTKRLDGEPLTEPGGAELLAIVLDQTNPPRLQLSQSQWVWRMMKAENIPKRKLLKVLYEEWRKAGYDLPRGFVFPNLPIMKRDIEKRIAITKEIQRLPSPSKMPRGEWEQAAAKIIHMHLSTG